MNRDLFKAKRKSWKELPKEEWWVEGYLFDDGMPEPKHYFIGGIIVKPYEGTACDKWNVVGIDFYEIDINTLCQYTGLTDKNGQKIWENDILKANLDERYPEDIAYIKILWNECGFCVHENYSTDIEALEKWDAEHFQVCGNIFDNPEMLEVE